VRDDLEKKAARVEDGNDQLSILSRTLIIQKTVQKNSLYLHYKAKNMI